MTEQQEIHFLRSKITSLDRQAKRLELAKSRLQATLCEVKSSSPRVKSDKRHVVLNVGHNQIGSKLLESSRTEQLLNLRLEWKSNGGPQPQKRNFRSDFLVWTQNNELATLLTYTSSQLQQKEEIVIDKQKEERRGCQDRQHILRKAVEIRAAKLFEEPQPQQDCSSTSKALQFPPSSSSREEYGEVVRKDVLRSNENNWQNKKSGGPLRRYKVQRGGSRTHPYRISDSDSNCYDGHLRNSSTYHNPPPPKNIRMDDLTEAEECRPFFSLPSSLFYYNQYSQCGLETLPEASSEEESLTTVKDDAFPEASSRSETSLSNRCRDDSQDSLHFSSGMENVEKRRGPLIDQGQREDKVILLETVIQQLRDELRECKDQNELLEFRLLEIEEAHISNNKQEETSEGDGTVPKTESPSMDISHLNGPRDDVSVPGGSDGNNHSAVTESRSSCSSDCSDTLSLQESGIFDGQGSDDGLSSPRSSRSHISREMKYLTFQIEELLKRYNEGNEASNEKSSEGSDKNPLLVDLGYCRQRVQEFEKRLSQMNDTRYIRSLEERINLILIENKRLEEERTEMEEAENDNRFLCQRLEEKVRHLKRKKLAFQAKLDEERSILESLKIQFDHVQMANLQNCKKASRLESLVQNYEQKNFELEEACIEMRDSVQFATNALPVLSFLYFWAYLCRWRESLSRSLLQPSRRLLRPMLCPSPLGVRPKPPARKHKLLERGVEPVRQKKCKSVEEQISAISMDEEQMRWVIGAKASSDVWSQTTEELWSAFTNEIMRRKEAEWKVMEKALLDKMDALEREMEKIGEEFASERQKLVEMYEEKLGEKDAELKARKEFAAEGLALKEKWTSLIQELEQFAVQFGRNLFERSEGLSEVGNSHQFQLFSKTGSGAEEGMMTTTRMMMGVESLSPPQLISFLQSTLKAHLRKFEWREQHLLDEIDRLVSEIKANADHGENNMVTHLTEENKRLQTLLNDHEKVWGDLKVAQEANERLKYELSETEGLRKKLEETQQNESRLRERLEELERTEACLQNQLSQMERKEMKGDQKIQQLREELQFLRNKCCELQNDVDARSTREAKYKTEIQLLTSKLKENKMELEEKESLLESNESLLQAQIAKLKTQLQELYQSFSDSECSNGMLREEVSYLEKTVEEAVARALRSENTATSLSHELKQKDNLIEELQAQLRQLQIDSSHPLSPNSSHELSDFHSCEGGLNGVVIKVQEAVGLIKKCHQCESVATKLMGISDTLIPLIQTLESASHVTDFRFGAEPELGMTRCESDEMLMSPSGPRPRSPARVPPISYTPEQYAVEDEVIIERLQTTMAALTLQISRLEEVLNEKQAELAETHAAEIGIWREKCGEKNILIQLLGRRLAHLSATDSAGHFMNGILQELRKVEKDLAQERQRLLSPLQRGRKQQQRTESPHDFSFATLRSFLSSERHQVLKLLESVPSEEAGDGDSNVPSDGDTGCDFRVLRKIGEDSLLVSWTLPGGTQASGGYEIEVNGTPYLKIPQTKRHKALLYGLNLNEPLQLTFKCPGDTSLHETTITFIS